MKHTKVIPVVTLVDPDVTGNGALHGTIVDGFQAVSDGTIGLLERGRAGIQGCRPRCPCRTMWGTGIAPTAMSRFWECCWWWRNRSACDVLSRAWVWDHSSQPSVLGPTTYKTTAIWLLHGTNNGFGDLLHLGHFGTISLVLGRWLFQPAAVDWISQMLGVISISTASNIVG
jgi:hypothetical protein